MSNGIGHLTPFASSASFAFSASFILSAVPPFCLVAVQPFLCQTQKNLLHSPLQFLGNSY